MRTQRSCCLSQISSRRQQSAGSWNSRRSGPNWASSSGLQSRLRRILASARSEIHQPCWCRRALLGEAGCSSCVTANAQRDEVPHTVPLGMGEGALLPMHSCRVFRKHDYWRTFDEDRSHCDRFPPGSCSGPQKLKNMHSNKSRRHKALSPRPAPPCPCGQGLESTGHQTLGGAMRRGGRVHCTLACPPHTEGPWWCSTNYCLPSKRFNTQQDNTNLS